MSDKMNKSLLAIAAAYDDAKAKGFKKGHAGQGSLKCPACPDGTINYSVAAVNGHMFARCTTQGCVAWMQ